MSLVTWSDLTAPAPSSPSLGTYDEVLSRVQDHARPMPPDPTQRVSDTELSALSHWVSDGARAGTPCTNESTPEEPGMAAGSDEHDTLPPASDAPVSTGKPEMPAAAGGPAPAPTHAAAGAPADKPMPPAADGGSAAPSPPTTDVETCYDLRAHGKSTPGDTTPYSVPGGETYTSFIFKAPWTTPVQGIRFVQLPDNQAVLHHWILYTERAPASDGDVQPCELSGLLGFFCGQGSTRSMITGWAPGRGDFVLPGGVGLELPAPGSMLALESHYYNNGAANADDKSGVQVCVTSALRPQTASISWLGTESIKVPANAAGQASGTCHPKRANLNMTDPIHILYSWPHMHKLGRHLNSVINRADGTTETLYDGDFSFEFQALHDTPTLLQPGDAITTTCSYQNTTPAAVGFGQSTTEEMCFNFVYAWPAHALDNSGANFGEASNTCLQ
jgi:hypothetical protein